MCPERYTPPPAKNNGRGYGGGVSRQSLFGFFPWPLARGTRERKNPNNTKVARRNFFCGKAVDKWPDSVGKGVKGFGLRQSYHQTIDKAGTMDTPVEYMNQLQKKILSNSLIGDVIYSLTARAKNASEKQRQYQDSNLKYSLDFLQKKRDYWKMRTEILNYGDFFPQELHIVERYSETKLLCQQGCLLYAQYIDALKLAADPLFCENPCTSKCPDRHVHREFIRNDYFLFFKIGNHSFHAPCSKKEADVYKKLPTLYLDEVFWDGAEIKNLLSVQFCKKVHRHFFDSGENIF